LNRTVHSHITLVATTIYMLLLLIKYTVKEVFNVRLPVPSQHAVILWSEAETWYRASQPYYTLDHITHCLIFPCHFYLLQRINPLRADVATNIHTCT